MRGRGFQANAGGNCGIGPGGFQPGNKCAKGGGGGDFAEGAATGEELIEGTISGKGPKFEVGMVLEDSFFGKKQYGQVTDVEGTVITVKWQSMHGSGHQVNTYQIDLDSDTFWSSPHMGPDDLANVMGKMTDTIPKNVTTGYKKKKLVKKPPPKKKKKKGGKKKPPPPKKKFKKGMFKKKSAKKRKPRKPEKTETAKDVRTKMKKAAGNTAKLEKYTKEKMPKRGTMADKKKNPNDPIFPEARLKQRVQQELGKRLRERAANDPELAKQVKALAKESDRRSPRKREYADEYEQMAANLVDAWAGTAADSNKLSLAVQSTAEKVFGLENPYKHKGTEQVVRQRDELLQKHGKALDAFVEETYANTQAMLKDAGITELVVFRGVGHVENQEGKRVETGIHDDQPIRMSPLSSFATSWASARNFAEMEGGDESAMVVTRVKAKDVFSTPLTGNGCRDEDEVVVIGRQKTVDRAIVFGMDDVIRGPAPKGDRMPGRQKPVKTKNDVHPSLGPMQLETYDTRDLDVPSHGSGGGMFDHGLIGNAPPELDLDGDDRNQDWPKRTNDTWDGLMAREDISVDPTQSAWNEYANDKDPTEDAWSLYLNAMGCGAGAPGSPGFEPGNKCAVGGRMAPSRGGGRSSGGSGGARKKPVRPKTKKKSKKTEAQKDKEFEALMKTKTPAAAAGFRKARAAGISIPPAATEVIWLGANKVPAAKYRMPPSDRFPKGKLQWASGKGKVKERSDKNNARIRKEVAPKIAALRKKARAAAKNGTDEDLIVHMMATTPLRVGNNKSAKFGAYGVTTLEARHVKVDGDTVYLNYAGKKGVKQKKSITDPVMAKELQKRLKGKSGKDRVFDTSDSKVRAKMREYGLTGNESGHGVTHDLRHVQASERARALIQEYERPKNAKERKAIIREVCELVSADLGNGWTQALNTYIDPAEWDVPELQIEE